jgi:lysophospholipase L1-like esterase
MPKTATSLKPLRLVNLAVLGDSLAYGIGDESGQGGWVGGLRQRLEKLAPYPASKNARASFVVYNLGLCGDSSLSGFARIDEVALRGPDILLIALGFNDMAIVNGQSSYSTLKPFLKKFWQQKLKALKATGTKIAVLGILPVREEMFPVKVSNQMQVSWLNKHIDEYNRMLNSVCKSAGVAFIPPKKIWPRDAKGFVCDGGHINAKGAKLAAENICKMLNVLKMLDLNHYRKTAFNAKAWQKAVPAIKRDVEKLFKKISSK